MMTTTSQQRDSITRDVFLAAAIDRIDEIVEVMKSIDVDIPELIDAKLHINSERQCFQSGVSVDTKPISR